MKYLADYIGYELGHFLLPKYSGAENCNVFFLLLQTPEQTGDAQPFRVKLGNSRFLKGNFCDDCLKVLLYFGTNGGMFSIFDIELKTHSDGTRFFDAVAFLNQIGVEYEMTDLKHYRYFSARLQQYAKEIIIQEENLSSFSIIHREINEDDYERLNVYKNVSDTSFSTFL